MVPAGRFDRVSYQVKMKHFIFGGKPDMTTEGEVCFYVAPKVRDRLRQLKPSVEAESYGIGIVGLN